MTVFKHVDSKEKILHDRRQIVYDENVAYIENHLKQYWEPGKSFSYASNMRNLDDKMLTWIEDTFITQKWTVVHYREKDTDYLVFEIS